MEQHILKNVIDYRGHQWKGISIYNSTEVNLQQNKTEFFEHCKKVQIKNLVSPIIVVFEKFICLPFQMGLTGNEPSPPLNPFPKLLTYFFSPHLTVAAGLTN
jgi:hypothetical protein